jgi:hypothetical protein
MHPKLAAAVDHCMSLAARPEVVGEPALATYPHRIFLVRHRLINVERG